MRNLITIVLALVLFTGCSKERRAFQVIVNKNNNLPVEVDIDGSIERFTDNTYTKEIEVGKIESVLVFVSYTNYDDESLTITVKNRGDVVKTTTGNGYVSAIISKDDVIVDGGSSYTGGGSSSGTCYCGAPTKDGTPCQRKVTCGTGYCWQHD